MSASRATSILAVLWPLPDLSFAAQFDGRWLSGFSGLLVITALSLKIIPSQVRVDNQFSRLSIPRVAMLFTGIFATIGPVMAMLKTRAMFMGANIYAGNAPNRMITPIAENRSAKIPNFWLQSWVGPGAGSAVHHHDFHLVQIRASSS